MKKIFLLSMLGWFMMSCTNEELANDPDVNAPSESSFMSIKIVSAGQGTRADADYKDGTEEESYVKNVLLLFFDDAGKPAQAVKDSGGTTYTYYLWEPTDTNTPEPDYTVEAVLKGTIPINVPRRDDGPIYPTTLLAIVNPPQIADYTGKTLEELRAKFTDYETDLSAKGKFVMTNSVYVDNNNSVVDTNSLEPENFRPTAEEAEENPIVIYVERILARIDLKIAINGTHEDGTEYPKLVTPENGDPYYIYYTGESIPTEKREEGNDADVYIRFLGWNLFNTPDQSYLMKHIDKTWDSQTLFGYEAMPWNIYEYRRSFWAINPKERDAETDPKGDGIYHKIGSFDEVQVGDFADDAPTWYAKKYEIPGPGETTTAYFQENAAPDDDWNQGPAATKRSTVVLAAQLVDKNGNPREIAKFAGKYYTWDGLRAMLTDKDGSNDYLLKDLYYGEPEKDDKGNTGMRYTKITSEDLGYTTMEGSYLVTMSLSTEGDAGAARTWYVKGADGTFTLAEEYVENFSKVENESDNTAATNQYIRNKIGSQTVMVWKNGYTYFYFAIRHLGKIDSGAPGEFGIVRNHIYEATVKSVYGLGTPVENEHEVFIPSSDEETDVLAAEVHILQWRVVRHDYDLSW